MFDLAEDFKNYAPKTGVIRELEETQVLHECVNIFHIDFFVFYYIYWYTLSPTEGPLVLGEAW